MIVVFVVCLCFVECFKALLFVSCSCLICLFVVLCVLVCLLGLFVGFGFWIDLNYCLLALLFVVVYLFIIVLFGYVLRLFGCGLFVCLGCGIAVAFVFFCCGSAECCGCVCLLMVG